MHRHGFRNGAQKNCPDQFSTFAGHEAEQYKLTDKNVCIGSVPVPASRIGWSGGDLRAGQGAVTSHGVPWRGSATQCPAQSAALRRPCPPEQTLISKDIHIVRRTKHEAMA